MSKAGRLTVVGALVGILIAGAVPAAADWLVLEDGGRVETRGPWEVRGGLVVFTAPNGTLSSVRTAQVDLEASRAATELATRPPEPPPPPPPKPKARVVLTDRDLPPVSRPLEEGSGEAGADADAARATEKSDSRLRVEDWNASTPGEFDGTIVAGRLRNVSRQLLMDVGVEVALYNTEGELLERRAATLPSGPLAPDRVLDFQVDFPGIFGAAGARFETQALAFLEEGATEAEPAGAAEGGASPTHDPMDGAEGARP